MRSVKNGFIYSYFYFPFVNDFANDFWSINNGQASKKQINSPRSNVWNQIS